MKLLFDENISHRIISLLYKLFPDCYHSRTLSPRLRTDNEIWNYAIKNKCLIVTFDSDFYHWQLLKGFPPKIIWLRCGNIPNEKLVQKLTLHHEKIIDFFSSKEEGLLEIF